MEARLRRGGALLSGLRPTAAPRCPEQSYVFFSIIAVVVGGVLLTGGYGSPVGVIFRPLPSPRHLLHQWDSGLVIPDPWRAAADCRPDQQHLPGLALAGGETQSRCSRKGPGLQQN
ncbi:MAG: hypothetical protein U0401_34605 [Anaerolineae bacterium]